MKVRPFFIGIILSILPIAVFANSGSLFSSNLQWKNDHGRTVKLGELRGKWVVTAMMYTSCQSSCPLIVQKMRKIESLFKEHGKQTEFLLITFDPERDTPTKLKNYREKTSINEANWHFWSGSVADTRKLSMLLGIKYAKDPESGEFMHDNKIILLSPNGTIEAKLQSLGESEADLLQAMNKGGIK